MDQRLNFAFGTVMTAPDPATTGTSIVLDTGHGARFPNTSGGQYVCVVKAANVSATPDNAEIVLVTSHDPAGDTFTITREQESSSARAVIVGDEFYLAPTKGVWDSIFVSPTFTGTVTLPKTTEIQDTSADHQYVLAVSELTADRTVTLPLLTAADEFMFKTHHINLYSADSIFRQALINGNFDVSQRATTFTSTSSANNDDVYTLDHWNLISDGNDILDVSQTAITDLPGSSYCIKLDVETAKRGGIVQFLEAVEAQKFKGKYVSVSFAVKSANISAIRAAVLSWGSTADAITSDVVGTWADTPTWATNWTSENTPADLTVTSSWTTVKIENIYIDSATVNNLALAIWLPNEETVGDIVYITQVQLNEGSLALPFMPKSYSTELLSCLRYYEVGSAETGQGEGGCIQFVGQVTSGVGFGAYSFYKVRKRAIPTINTVSNVYADNFSTTTGSVTYGTAMVMEIRSATGTGYGRFLSRWTVSAEL